MPSMKITTRRLKDIGFEEEPVVGNDVWFSFNLKQCHLLVQRRGSVFSIFHPKKGFWAEIKTMKDLFDVIYHNGYQHGYRKHQNETAEVYHSISKGIDFLSHFG